MANILKIEKAIKELPRDAYGQLRQWLEDYELAQELGASSAQMVDLLDQEDGGENQLLAE